MVQKIPPDKFKGTDERPRHLLDFTIRGIFQILRNGLYFVPDKDLIVFGNKADLVTVVGVVRKYHADISSLV